MNTEEFGKFLTEKRKERGLSIYKLSKESGVSHTYISQLEHGAKDQPSPEILKKLAGPLGISYGELMHAAGYLANEEYRTEDTKFSRLVFNGKNPKRDQMLRVIMGLEPIGADITEMAIESNDPKFHGKPNLEIMAILEHEAKQNELLFILANEQLTFNGHLLSEEDRMLIERLLIAAFPKYAPKEY